MPIAHRQVWKVKPASKCRKSAFFLTAAKGEYLRLQKELWEDSPQ